jgi:hypothetical protein
MVDTGQLETLPYIKQRLKFTDFLKTILYHKTLIYDIT